MKAPTHQLALGFDSVTDSNRKEQRSRCLARVEYAPYPRRARSQCESIGFTLDRSESGLRIRCVSAEDVGALIRVVVRDLGDRPIRDIVAHVVWCKEVGPGAFDLGLRVVAEGRSEMRTVRQNSAARGVAASA